MRLQNMTLSLALGAGLCAQQALAQNSSPFPPPTEKLGTYVASTGSGLDTGCTYRSGGPLRINIPVPIVVNPLELNADGTLKNPQKLIANGVLSAQATVSFPVYDIDDQDNSNVQVAPEVDQVLLNGRYKKSLAGFNETWTDDVIVVPIEEIKFGQDNELRIDIDTANVASGEYWCMAVDWVSIAFDVTPPYVLQHGISASQSTWDEGSANGVIGALDERGVLYTRFSLGASAGGNGSAAANANELNGRINEFLRPLKGEKVHIIAHSKGGLDSQALQAIGPEFEIASLSTLSTPHLGSVAADLSLIQKQSANGKINNGSDPNGFASAYIDTWTFGQGPQLPGLADLSTYAATTALGTGQRNNIGRTLTLGADADLNGDNALTPNESAPLFPGTVHYAAERAWLVLRDLASAPMTLTTIPGNLWGTRSVLTYTTNVAPLPQANDIVVTLNSANPGYGTALDSRIGNHSTVKNGANVNAILDATIPIK